MITPVYANGRIIGYIVNNDKGSYYVQAKIVKAGICANYGLNANYIVRDGVDHYIPL